MSDEHIPDLPPESIIELGEIDLAIEEVLRSLDEHLAEFEIELDEVDRAMLINHIRWSFIEGWTQRHFEAPPQIPPS